MGRLQLDLSFKESDAIDRAVREAALAVNRALDTLVRGEAKVALRSTQVLARSEVAPLLESLMPAPAAEVVVAYAPATGQEGGATLLLMSQAAVLKFADGLLGLTEGATKKLDPTGTSAVREATSVLGNAAFHAMNDALGHSIIPGVPRVLPPGKEAAARALEQSFRDSDALVFHAAFDISFGAALNGVLLLFSPAQSLAAFKARIAAAEKRQTLILSAPALAASSLVPTSQEEVAPLSPAPKVLIIDDSLYFRTLTTRMLSWYGMTQVAATGDPMQAATLYRMHRPDVVLLDMLMEGKNGMRVLRELRDMDSEAKIIVVSAVSQELMVGECMRQGARGFLVKPVTADRLADEIRKALGPKSTESRSEAPAAA